MQTQARVVQMSNTNRSHGLRDGKTTKACKSCENHGGCHECEGNRLHKHNKTEKESLNASDRLSEFYEWRDAEFG